MKLVRTFYSKLWVTQEYPGRVYKLSGHEFTGWQFGLRFEMERFSREARRSADGATKQIPDDDARQDVVPGG